MDILKIAGDAFGTIKSAFAKIEDPKLRTCAIVGSCVVAAAFAWKALPWLMLAGVIAVVGLFARAIIKDANK